MKRPIGVTLLLLWLALGLSAQLSSSNPGVSASANSGNGFIAGSNTQGAVMNGQPLLSGTAVLPGDSVTTLSGGTATLVSTGTNGGVVQLGQQTLAKVTSSNVGPQVNLMQGAVQAQGTVQVQTCNSMETPANNQTIVTITAQGCQQTNVQQIAGNSSVKNLSSNTVTNSSASLQAGQAVQVNGNNVQFVSPSQNTAANFPAPQGNGNQNSESQSK